MVDRLVVLNKLNALLDGQISREQAYEWALATAVSDDYETSARKDVLLGRVIQALVDLSSDALLSPSIREYLCYLQRCLRGEEDFSFHEERLQAQGPGDQGLKAKEDALAAAPRNKSYLFLARVYVNMFAFSCLFFLFFTSLHPRAFLPARAILSQLMLLDDLLIYIIHAAIMLLPTKKSAQDPLFYFCVLMLSFGAFNYWYLAFQIISWLRISPFFILSIIPFSSLPPSLALILLLMRRFEMSRSGQGRTRPAVQRKAQAS